MRYISLLRGINVSGQKKIKMSDLESLYEKLGYQDVVTYIQSGNVIFNSDIKDRSKIIQNIENGITKKYKFHVPVTLRTRREISDIIKKCPFGSVDLALEGTKVLVTFLSAKPLKEKLALIKKYVAASEKIILMAKEIYLHCPNGYGKSKLSNAFLENKLGVVATTRNWKSVHKLYDLSGQD